MKTTLQAAAFTFIAASSTVTNAATIHDESINGDLSGLLNTPTPLTVSAGTNTIIGQVGNNGNTGATDGTDADYFTFNIAPGSDLVSITIDSYTSSSGSGQSFFGYTEGTSFTGQGFGDIDGFVIFNASSGEVLDDLSGGASLAAGDYAFWLQETADVTVDYEISFEVATVPVPAAAWLFGSGLLGLMGIARRKKA